ncbi:hypothetical protein FM113_07970 [Leucobacter sp. 7(1)]|nr:hypothetical protein FM113_07970 [Leucobacter sp. 7(1)]
MTSLCDEHIGWRIERSERADLVYADIAVEIHAQVGTQG